MRGLNAVFGGTFHQINLKLTFFKTPSIILGSCTLFWHAFIDFHIGQASAFFMLKLFVRVNIFKYRKVSLACAPKFIPLVENFLSFGMCYLVFICQNCWIGFPSAMCIRWKVTLKSGLTALSQKGKIIETNFLINLKNLGCNFTRKTTRKPWSKLRNCLLEKRETTLKWNLPKKLANQKSSGTP